MDEHDIEVKCIGRRLRDYLNARPLTGWWLAALGCVNIILNLLELVK